jgi:ribosomal protein L32
MIYNNFNHEIFGGIRMFFIGIFGIQNKEKMIREFENVVCPSCGRLSRAELIESYTYFHFFFIPLFRWGYKYFLRLRCCGSIYEVEKEYADELKRTDAVDFTRLKKLGATGGFCPNCGAYVHPGFNFCPHCGTKL